MEIFRETRKCKGQDECDTDNKKQSSRFSSKYNTCVTDRHCSVLPQTSQCFGWSYEKYQASKTRVEKQVWVSKKKIKISLAKSFVREMLASADNLESCWQVLFLRTLQVETRPFVKVSHQAKFLLSQKQAKELELRLEQQAQC